MNSQITKTKVDVCVCLFGKPYHTILAIKSLLKHSRQHIETVYVVEERKQPQKDINGIFLLKEALKNEPVVYFKPKHFYDLGKLDYQRVKSDADYRYCIPYQYALENSDKNYVLVIHNDCLFHGDIIGEMLQKFKEGNGNLAGVGPIGQCWNCPAFFESKCSGATYDKFIPSQEELTTLINRHEIPRREITERLIAEGRVHPLPECRLNEYAALLNTTIYRKSTLPEGKNVTYAGAWDGNDWGTVWFHQMVNQGYDFKHVTLEDYATHAPFNPIGNGISAYSRADLYWESEKLAKEELERSFDVPILSLQSKLFASLNTVKHGLKNTVAQLFLKISNKLKS